MIRILFVDDEPNILQGLQRMLRPMRHEWQPRFVESGQAALLAMEQETFDMIVSDMRMPGMTGAQLLAQVRQRYPATARIVLSGQTDREQVMLLAANAHQYLAKPCEEETLMSTIRRVSVLGELLPAPILRQIASKAQQLPSAPSVYSQVVAAIESNQASVAQIGDLIASDVAMAAKVLQLSNSLSFGAVRNMANSSEAVKSLGMETIYSLSKTDGVFCCCHKSATASGLDIDTLQAHSAQVASIARNLAGWCGYDPKMQDEAYTAGLLHDIGKLVLAVHLSERYRKALDMAAKKRWPQCQAERESLGASHAKVGGYLLALWGLPGVIVDAVAWHHRPIVQAGVGESVAGIVHIANALAHAAQEKDDPMIWLDREYLACAELTDRVNDWRKLVAEAA